jgi:hypothetical protein
MKDPIKLKLLLELLQSCYDKHKDDSCAEHISVEFWHGEKLLELGHIGQFQVVPDVTINFKSEEDNDDEKG